MAIILNKHTTESNMQRHCPVELRNEVDNHIIAGFEVIVRNGAIVEVTKQLLFGEDLVKVRDTRQ